MPERAPHWTRWLWVSAAVVVLDFATKAWIRHAFVPGEGVDLNAYLRIMLVYNTGAAFSFLADAGGWQRWFFTALSLVISVGIVVLLRRPHPRRMVPVALALVLGGALGNVWDRVALGHVVDFIVAHVGDHAWPAFNAADSAITIGVALLLIDTVRSGSAPREARAGEEP